MEKHVLFVMDKAEDAQKLRDFKARMPGVAVKDHYEEMLEELCAIKNPSLRGAPDKFKEVWTAFLAEHRGGRALEECGTWVYFPWNNLLLHYLPETLHNELRTARNRNLITVDEQKLFADAIVGIAGLSVGSHAALTIAMMGGCTTMKLADPDVISGSNLNRIRLGYSAVGEKKVEMAARIIYDMNPYAKLELFDEGVTKENFPDFVGRGGRVRVVVEETDDLALKIKIRQWAKAERLPVIMATDNGDGVIVDVERYDLDPNLPLFGGRLKEIPDGDLKGLTPQERARVATQIVDPSVVEPRMIASVQEVGQTLYSWPQLGDAATLAGVTVAYLIKSIVIGGSCPTKRWLVSLDSIFGEKNEKGV
jgi:molybdopterin/thiamine biosynthesis adenylyltransferase